MAKEEQKERILSEPEIRRLIDNSDTPLRYIIMVAINTGMRKKGRIQARKSRHPIFLG
jgi:integrase